MLRRKAYNDKQISDMIEQMTKTKEERWCRPIGRSQISSELDCPKNINESKLPIPLKEQDVKKD